jgi:hypothetical protein
MQKLHELITNNLIEEKLSEKGKLLIKYAESKKSTKKSQKRKTKNQKTKKI